MARDRSAPDRDEPLAEARYIFDYLRHIALREELQADWLARLELQRLVRGSENDDWYDEMILTSGIDPEQASRTVMGTSYVALRQLPAEELRKHWASFRRRVRDRINDEHPGIPQIERCSTCRQR